MHIWNLKICTDNITTTGGKNSSSPNGTEKIKLGDYLKVNTIIYSKWLKDLNMKSKYFKFLEKNESIFLIFKVRKEFLNKTQKHKPLRKELINSTWKICTSQETITNWKDKPQKVEDIVSETNKTSESCIKHIKFHWKPEGKRQQFSRKNNLHTRNSKFTKLDTQKNGQWTLDRLLISDQ